jgi:hypothetical protein
VELVTCDALRNVVVFIRPADIVYSGSSTLRFFAMPQECAAVCEQQSVPARAWNLVACCTACIFEEQQHTCPQSVCENPLAAKRLRLNMNNNNMVIDFFINCMADDPGSFELLIHTKAV